MGERLLKKLLTGMPSSISSPNDEQMKFEINFKAVSMRVFPDAFAPFMPITEEVFLEFDMFFGTFELNSSDTSNPSLKEK
jgi:hypothetical protein